MDPKKPLPNKAGSSQALSRLQMQAEPAPRASGNGSAVANRGDPFVRKAMVHAAIGPRVENADCETPLQDGRPAYSFRHASGLIPLAARK